MENFSIIGTGSYTPQFVLTNEILEQMVETSDEWITSRVGIKERRVSQGEPTWYMGMIAAKRALESSGINKDEVDLIIVSTTTPDYYFPSTSCIIQNELELFNATCFDVSAACTGFIYAIDMASKYLKDEKYNNILIISSEVVSKVVDYTDRSTCVLFGDGSGAILVSKNGDGKILSSHIGTDGSGYMYISSKALEIDTPFAKDEIKEKYNLLKDCKNKNMLMNGQPVFKFATRTMVNMCKKVMDNVGLSIENIDYIIPHQANARIIEHAVKKLGIAENKVATTLTTFGNTSSSSIPIALDDAIRTGKIKKGDNVIFTGFGSGLTYGAVLLKI